jgi:hypothetical protein
MPLTPRALSLGKTLKEAFLIYGQHFVLFLSISAIPNLVLLALQLGVAKLPIGRPQATGWLAFVAGFGASFASLFASSIATAAATVAVFDIYLDRPPDLWECFSRLSGKAFRVVYAAFLVELIVGVGTLLCILPGIYWGGVYGITIPAVVLENLTARQALSRSEGLTRGSVGRIILSFFLTSILTGIMVAALKAGALALGFNSSSYQGIPSKEALRLIITALGGVLFGPISAIALALEYFDQRVRKESFDIEQMRALMVTPEQLASGAHAGPIN